MSQKFTPPTVAPPRPLPVMPRPVAPGTGTGESTHEGGANPAPSFGGGFGSGSAAGLGATGAAQAQSDMRKLDVSRGITFKGQIEGCDYLLVNGTVEASLKDCEKLEISDNGLFRGTVELSDADIAGIFEGEITVRNRLRVRSTGRIDGKVVYGELELEAGGQIEGEIRGLKGAQRQGRPATGAAASATSAASKGGSDSAT